MSTIRQWSPAEVAERLDNGEKLFILDIREDGEWVSGHIPGARHLPLGQLPYRHDVLDRNTEMVVVCLSGGRSSNACEYLADLGYKVVNMPGGMSMWPGKVIMGR
ncbi:rhodanese-like domain-containing protein [Gorillibacterium massiliense]|uniref:rhodanese-like domain-containing protein n=1 Tax=Gorillibacterium massiliense TaxID=1280390 RepID=UPI000592465A|nr:rhodanese-like domain-containing protein [Gorillibacterium massiliense]